MAPLSNAGYDGEEEEAEGFGRCCGCWVGGRGAAGCWKDEETARQEEGWNGVWGREDDG